MELAYEYNFSFLAFSLLPILQSIYNVQALGSIMFSITIFQVLVREKNMNLSYLMY